MPRVNDAVKLVVVKPQEFEDQQGNTFFEPGSERWETDERGAGTNCALCTAAALITEKIDNPNERKTAGIVNAGLQQELGWLLGEPALEAIWKEYSKAHENDLDWDDDNPPEWKQWQRDDAFAWYARYERSLKSRLRTMTDPDRLQKLADQIIGLAGYVEKKLNTEVRYHGFPGGEETTPKTARPFMLRQPEGTRFAVLTDAVLADYGYRLHWTYAEKRSGKITYKDFQLDREGSPEPRASSYPLGPNGIEYKKDNILMTVLAFGKGLVGGGKL
jgi:hypothetical protein